MVGDARALSPSPNARRWPWIAAALLLVAMLVQAVTSMRLLSLTSDELTHIPSGYSYLKTGEIRLNPQHPPLVKLLAAVPLLGIDPVADFDDPSFRAEPPREWEFGFRFFEANDADRVLFRARMPVVLLSLWTGLVVFLWGRDLFGPWAGVLALGLFAFDPNAIAHSRFVTMDAPLACFMLTCLYFLWRYTRRGSRVDLVVAGLALGATLTTKFSGLVLLPVVGLLLLAWALWPGGRAASRQEAGGRAAGVLVVLLVLAAVCVAAVYLGPSGLTEYVEGARRVNVDHDPDYAYFLLGEFRPGGFWYYFPAAFLFKTPLTTLLLLAASLLAFRARPGGRRLDDLFLALPALVFFLFTAALADNLGVRYLLPVYPLLYVWISRLVVALPAAGRARQVAVAALALFAAVHVGGAVRIWPDHLSYFNLLAGGPANGHRILDDSNIDWGQDLKRLGLWMEREGVERVRLLYGGNASPRYYGIAFDDVSEREWAVEPRPPGLYAVSTHLLIRGEHHARTRGLATDWLSRYEPVGRIGYSIYLFRFE
jgi:hypothetical protein